MSKQSLFDDEPTTISDLKLKCKLIPIEYKDIIFSPLSQLVCQNCGMFGRTFVCPPFTRKYDKTREYLKQFDKFIFIISESDPAEYEKRYTEIKSKFNLSEYRIQNLVGTQINAMNCGNARHDLKIVVGFIKSRYNKYNFLEVGGGCNRCRICQKWLHKPCAHPNEARASCEGSGIDVYTTLRNIGYVELESPPIKKYISVAFIYCGDDNK